MDLLVNMGLIPSTISQESLRKILSDLHIDPIISAERENPYFRALSLSFYLFQLSLSASKIFFKQKGKLLTQAIKSISNDNLVDINPSLPPETMTMMDDMCFLTATTIIDTLLTHVTLSDNIDLTALKISLKETLYLSLQTIHMSPRSMKSLLHIITHYYLDHHPLVENISSHKTQKEYQSLRLILETWHRQNLSLNKLYKINLHPLGNQLLNNIPGATPRRIFGCISQLIELIRYVAYLPMLAFTLHVCDIVSIHPNYFSFIYWLGGDLNVGLLIVGTIALSAFLGNRFYKSAKNAQTAFKTKVLADIQEAFVFNRKMITVSKTKAVVVIQGKDSLPLHIQSALWDKYNKETPNRPLLEDDPEENQIREKAAATASDKQQEQLVLPADHYPYFREKVLCGVILLRTLIHLGKGHVTKAWWGNILQEGRFSIEPTSHERNKSHGTHKVKPNKLCSARLLLKQVREDVPAGIPKVPYYIATHSRASHV